MCFIGTFCFKTSVSTFRILTRNLKSNLKSPQKVKISYQKMLLLDFKVQKIPTCGSESV